MTVLRVASVKGPLIAFRSRLRSRTAWDILRPEGDLVREGLTSLPRVVPRERLDRSRSSTDEFGAGGGRSMSPSGRVRKESLAGVEPPNQLDILDWLEEDTLVVGVGKPGTGLVCVSWGGSGSRVGARGGGLVLCLGAFEGVSEGGNKPLSWRNIWGWSRGWRRLGGRERAFENRGRWAAEEWRALKMLRLWGLTGGRSWWNTQTGDRRPRVEDAGPGFGNSVFGEFEEKGGQVSPKGARDFYVAYTRHALHLGILVGVVRVWEQLRPQHAATRLNVAIAPWHTCWGGASLGAVAAATRGY